MTTPRTNQDGTPTIRELSNKLLRCQVKLSPRILDLPRIRAALFAVHQLVTRHEEFNPDIFRSDFVFTLSEAITYDPETWRPYGEAIIKQLTELKKQGKLQTRYDYLDAWAQIIDSIDDVLEHLYKHPQSRRN